MCNFQKRSAICTFVVSCCILIICGCGSPNKNIVQDENSYQKKYALLTNLINKDFRTLTQKGDREFGGLHPPPGIGLLGGAIFGAIAGALENAAFREEVGGNPKRLKKALKKYPITTNFDKIIDSVLSLNFDIRGSSELGNIKAKRFFNTIRARREEKNKCRKLREKYGIDYLVEINYLYGIVCYKEGLFPSAGIVAEVVISDTQSKKILMDTTICSDAYYKRNIAVDKLAEDDGELFKVEIIKAIEGFAHLISSELGVEIDTKEKSFWNTSE